MKKLILLFVLLLVSCTPKEKGWHAVIRDYDYSYQTSEVQEITHDVRLAVCDNEVYIPIDENYDKPYVNLKYTGNYVYYRVYKVSDHKVSNKGWEQVCKQ